MIAVSLTVRHLTVVPSAWHHVSGCDAVCVCACPWTLRMHALPSRDRVLFFMNCAGNCTPAASKASATETRWTGVSRSRCIIAGGPAMIRFRVVGAPRSAASTVVYAISPLRANSSSNARTGGVDTFSRLQDVKLLSSTHLSAWRIPAFPSSMADPDAPLLAFDSVVQGGLRWMWRLGRGAGMRTRSVHRVVNSPFPPVLPLHNRRTESSQS